MTKGGRRFTLVGSLLITGLACLATGLVPSGRVKILMKLDMTLISYRLRNCVIEPAVYQIICSLIGKFFASVSSACLYTFTSELFQTSSRAAVIGLCSTAGRIGSILAPIIADMVNL